MQVPYEIKKTEFGEGVFSKKSIKKGTLVWKFVRGANVRSFKGPKATREYLNTLKSADKRKDWLDHSYHMGGTVNYVLDDGGLFNHAEGKKATTTSGTGEDPLSSYAIRNIKAGEEFLEDYGSYEWPVWFVKMCYEFNSEMDYFDIKLKPGVAGFQVKYKIKKCKYGKGIFAEENIKKGTLIWKYKRGVNVRALKGQKAVRDHLAKLPTDEARKDWLVHMYPDRGYCNEILNDSKMWNHSSKPNTGLGPDPNSSYAIRNIKKGEELLDDYNTYGWPSWLLNLHAEYNVDTSYFNLLL
jgi:SET domain-containing protein